VKGVQTFFLYLHLVLLYLHFSSAGQNFLWGLAWWLLQVHNNKGALLIEKQRNAFLKNMVEAQLTAGTFRWKIFFLANCTNKSLVLKIFQLVTYQFRATQSFLSLVEKWNGGQYYLHHGLCGFLFSWVIGWAGRKVSPVHRLDRPASGALIFSKSSDATRAAQASLAHPACIKEWASCMYHCQDIFFV
jgi:hypothetical protein